MSHRMSSLFSIKFSLFSIKLLAMLTALLACAVVRAEDVAVLVGVGHYPHLPDSTLPGIDNDVAQMSAALRARGFSKIVCLLDREATKEAIREVFLTVRRSVRPEDRFLYYQSSHGSLDHRLLTYDATLTGENNISVEEMRAWIEAVPTRHKTLLLDACFSGGFLSRAAQGGITKFYALPSKESRTKEARTKEARTTVVQQNSTRVQEAYAGDYAFFGSSQPNEASLIFTLEGRPGSVFTHCLAEQLSQKASAAWGSIVQPTVSEVVKKTDGRQTPVFSTRYLVCGVFGGIEDRMANVTAPIHNLAEFYDFQGEDTESLLFKAQMAHAPDDLNRFLPDTAVTLTLSIKRPGYLFVINQDDAGQAQLVGWSAKELDTSSVEGMVEGSRIDAAPDAFVFGRGTLNIHTNDRNGFERWKAFLFRDREQARQFSERWRQAPKDKDNIVLPGSLAKIQFPTGTRIGVNALYTAEVNYKVKTSHSAENPAENTDIDR